MEIPVYLFTGFLEAGKTRLIQESMRDPHFNAGENTLILVCEEGIDEYNVNSFASKNVTVTVLENETDLAPEYFAKLIKNHKFERVIIEYNGMWQLDSLYRALPDNFMVYQEVFIADSTTFANYNANMRSLVADKLRSCEMVIFNRVTDITDKMALHKAVRSLTTQASIVFEHCDGSVENDEIEDPLPFDIDADVIEIADRDYAIFYRDLAENTGKYIGKCIKFKGIIAKDADGKIKGTVIGRHIMTCCANDIAYQGFVVKAKNENDFKTRDWAIVTGTLKMEKHPLYRGEGPVLYADSLIPSEKPEKEVATFY